MNGQTSDRELMQQALDALESCYEDQNDYGEWRQYYDDVDVDKAMDALRARLAQPEPEPVAHVFHTNGVDEPQFYPHWDRFPAASEDPIPLYTAPPRKEWQGLTDEEIETFRADCIDTPPELRDRRYGWAIAFARAIETKLKEKNDV